MSGVCIFFVNSPTVETWKIRVTVAFYSYIVELSVWARGAITRRKEKPSVVSSNSAAQGICSGSFFPLVVTDGCEKQYSN